MGSLENNSSLNIPLIDFRTWTSSDVSKEDRHKTAQELVSACRAHGFVYIKNHGISAELLKESFEWAEKFFDLPTEQKKLAANKRTGIFRGYVWPEIFNADAFGDDFGKNAKAVLNLNETFDWGSDSNLEQPNVWPPDEILPGFRAFDTKLYWECWRVAENVLKALAIGLDLPDEEFLLKLHTGHDNELSFKHYHPVKASTVESDEVRRLVAHTDADSFTLLFQDDCGGLEVEKKDSPGEFVAVDPLEGTLVMNVGDALGRWSNDILRSTKHRVHLPPLQDRYTGDERMTRKRYSIPYFVAPTSDSVMECLPGCSTAENPAKYEPMTFGEWSRLKGAAAFA